MKYRSGACHTEGNEGLLAVDSHGVTSHIRGSREESSEQQAHRTEAFSLVRQPHFVMRSAVRGVRGGGTISRGLGGGVARGSTAGGGVRAGAGG